MELIDDVVAKLDEAVNTKNLKLVLSFYEEGALLVMEPGYIAKGKAEIRSFFESIFDRDIKVSQVNSNVMETGGIALFTSKWVARGFVPTGEKFFNENIATSVFRKGSDNKWRLVIDK